MEPLVGCIIPSSSRARVVLQLPLSPAMVVIDGLSSLIISETPSTATDDPQRVSSSNLRNNNTPSEPFLTLTCPQTALVRCINGQLFARSRHAPVRCPRQVRASTVQ